MLWLGTSSSNQCTSSTLRWIIWVYLNSVAPADTSTWKASATSQAWWCHSSGDVAEEYGPAAWEYGPAPHWPVKMRLWRGQRCCYLLTLCKLSCFVLIVHLLPAQLGHPTHCWRKETRWKCKVMSIHLRTNQIKALSKLSCRSAPWGRERQHVKEKWLKCLKCSKRALWWAVHTEQLVYVAS